MTTGLILLAAILTAPAGGWAAGPAPSSLSPSAAAQSVACAPVAAVPGIRVPFLSSGPVDPPARFGGPSSPMTNTYMAPDAKIQVQRVDGRLQVDYDTGQQWGGGFSLFIEADVKGLDAISARGSVGMALQLEAPAGLSLCAYVNESGADSASVFPQRGQDGADGESFGFPGLVSQGGKQALTLHWDQALPHREWGNQLGNRVLDVQALKYVDIHLPGGQGAGRLWFDEAVTIPRGPYQRSGPVAHP